MVFKKGFDPRRYKFTKEDQAKGGRAKSLKKATRNLKHGKYSQLLSFSQYCNECKLQKVCSFFGIDSPCQVHVLAVKVLMKGLQSDNPQDFINEIEKILIPLYIQATTIKDPDLLIKCQNQMIRIYEMKFGKVTPDIYAEKAQILQMQIGGGIGGPSDVDEGTLKSLIESIREIKEDSS